MRRAASCTISSATRLVAPITLVGFTALSVEMSTKWLTPAAMLASTSCRVPSTLFVTASSTLSSISGTCLCAAAWKTISGRCAANTAARRSASRMSAMTGVMRGTGPPPLRWTGARWSVMRSAVIHVPNSPALLPRSSRNSLWMSKMLFSPWPKRIRAAGSKRRIWRHSSEPIEPPCAGHEHALAADQRGHLRRVGLHRLAAQQVLDLHIAQLLDADTAVQQLVHAWNDARRHAGPIAYLQEFANRLAGRAGHGDDHLVHLLSRAPGRGSPGGRPARARAGSACRSCRGHRPRTRRAPGRSAGWPAARAAPGRRLPRAGDQHALQHLGCRAGLGRAAAALRPQPQGETRRGDDDQRQQHIDQRDRARDAGEPEEPGRSPAPQGRALLASRRRARPRPASKSNSSVLA